MMMPTKLPTKLPTEMPTILTIGVYGYSQESFFSTLDQAEIDTFCDVRWRRGVRGAEYAFANSNRLQARLAEMGIRYLHLRALAPTPDIRAQQYAADKASKTAKRSRYELDPAFVHAYEAGPLADFDSQAFLESLAPGHRAVLFCVEREATACHRSLIAQRLQEDTGIIVEHMKP